jgi:hypothetical protein
MGIKESSGGSVTFAQRFGSALNLNPHFHSLLLDRMFNTKTDTFHSAPPLKNEDVKEIVEITAHRMIRMFKRKGVLNADEYDCVLLHADSVYMLPLELTVGTNMVWRIYENALL